MPIAEVEHLQLGVEEEGYPTLTVEAAKLLEQEQEETRLLEEEQKTARLLEQEAARLLKQEENRLPQEDQEAARLLEQEEKSLQEQEAAELLEEELLDQPTPVEHSNTTNELNKEDNTLGQENLDDHFNFNHGNLDNNSPRPVFVTTADSVEDAGHTVLLGSVLEVQLKRVEELTRRLNNSNNSNNNNQNFNMDRFRVGTENKIHY